MLTLNERVVYRGQWRHGFFSMTAVGATNVGSIVVPPDNTLQTNLPERGVQSNQPKENKFDNLLLRKGQYFGTFNLGSSIVVVFEAAGQISFQVKAGDQVKMGQRIAEMVPRGEA